MKNSAWKLGVISVGLVAGGCVAPDFEQGRREDLRREFGSGQISQREYQQQLDQMERTKAETAAGKKK